VRVRVRVSESEREGESESENAAEKLFFYFFLTFEIIYRQDPVGYAVVRLHFQAGQQPVRHSIVLANGEKRSAGNSPAFPMPADWYHRPVGLGVGPCGESNECLYITSDASGVSLKSPPPPPQPTFLAFFTLLIETPSLPQNRQSWCLQLRMLLNNLSLYIFIKSSPFCSHYTCHRQMCNPN